MPAPRTSACSAHRIVHVSEGTTAGHVIRTQVLLQSADCLLLRYPMHTMIAP